MGGVSNQGGKGTVFQAFVGVLIIGILENGMLLLNISEYWQRGIQGLLLLIAVVYDAGIARNAEKIKKLKAINSKNVA